MHGDIFRRSRCSNTFICTSNGRGSHYMNRNIILLFHAFTWNFLPFQSQQPAILCHALGFSSSSTAVGSLRLWVWISVNSVSRRKIRACLASDTHPPQHSWHAPLARLYVKITNYFVSNKASSPLVLWAYTGIIWKIFYYFSFLQQIEMMIEIKQSSRSMLLYRNCFRPYTMGSGSRVGYGSIQRAFAPI